MGHPASGPGEPGPTNASEKPQNLEQRGSALQVRLSLVAQSFALGNSAVSEFLHLTAAVIKDVVIIGSYVAASTYGAVGPIFLCRLPPLSRTDTAFGIGIRCFC